MRTVYLGTSSFAAAVLERLAGSDHRPALVPVNVAANNELVRSKCKLLDHPTCLIGVRT